MKSELTVVVPTLNNVKGLNYLKNYFRGKPYGFVVVDNSKVNLGFAAGVNKGANGINTEWLLILNDDIEFKERNTLEELIKEAERKKIDALSPTLRNPDGKVENYGYRILPFGRIELVKKLAGLKVERLDGITAACLLIKTDIFKKLGGFDESFFAYLEDVDFFLRFKKAGYKMGVSGIEVLHNHMTTTKTMGSFKQRQDLVNWWRLYRKHPDKFRLNFEFILERFRNLSGYLKASFGLLS